MSTFVARLMQDFPSLSFLESDSFYWSPRKQVVHYAPLDNETTVGKWSLLHEVGHALLEHQDYQTDFDLLLLEISAWEKAKELAKKYNEDIDTEHIQDCLDTYRDWLYSRSTCPKCMNCSLQIDTHTYSCFNCNEVWHVSRSRKCRTYRKKQPASQLQTA